MSLNNFELPGNLVAFGHLASGSETENWKSDFNPINMVFIGKLIGRSHAVKIEYEIYCMTHTVWVIPVLYEACMINITVYKHVSRTRLWFCIDFKNRESESFYKSFNHNFTTVSQFLAQFRATISH